MSSQILGDFDASKQYENPNYGKQSIRIKNRLTQCPTFLFLMRKIEL